MKLIDHKELFTIDDYFFILKKQSSMHKNEHSRNDSEAFLSWKTEEWYLGKINGDLRLEGSVYVLPSSFSSHYDSNREERERRKHMKNKLKKRFKPGPNPTYVMNEVRFDMSGIMNFSINGNSYFPDHDLKVHGFKKLEILIGSQYVKKYMAGMGIEHIFTSFSRLL